MTKVLITGGTGMIGAPLTELLLNVGYEVDFSPGIKVHQEKVQMSHVYLLGAKVLVLLNLKTF